MIAIINGKVVTVTGETFERGTVLIEDDKIKAVGADVAIPDGAQILDAKGCWVTPGLIDCHTHICNFGEPSTNPGPTWDGNEITDPVTPQVRAIDAVNPYDYAISKVRNAGFTTVCILPGSANVVCGSGVVVKLRDVATADEMVLPGHEPMKFATGENPKRCYGQHGKSPMTRMGVASVLRETLFRAKVYSDKLKAAETDPSKAPEPDFQLDALVPVVRGQMRCRFHAHRSDDIVTVMRVAEEFHLDYTIEHCTEGFRVVDALKAKNVRCTIGPYLWEPSKQEIWNKKLETPVNDMVKSFIAFYEQNGRLPVWNFWGSETDMMIGYHAVPVIVDAYLKGIGDFDAEKALEACVATANLDDYRGIGLYKKLGYIPYNIKRRKCP